VPTVEKVANPLIGALCRLPLLAYCGRREATERILNGELAHLSSDIKSLWLAIGDLAAGQTEQGRAQLSSIPVTCGPLIRQAVDQRLLHGLIVAETVLTDRSRQVVARVEQELDHESRYEMRRSFGSWHACGTYTLIALNLAMFGFEMSLGDTTNVATLYRAGAVYPEAVVAGQRWRVFTACFLHFGLTHLLINMLALYVLGRFVEYSLGIIRYVLTYLAAGVGSALFLVYLVQAGRLTAGIEAGASGCIMGLVGATGAILARGWRAERARIAFKRLMTIGLIVVLQAVFDLLTPQVSFTVHTSGLAIGFFVALLLFRPMKSRGVVQAQVNTKHLDGIGT
jgi:rhomboid protease GluP